MTARENGGADGGTQPMTKEQIQIIVFRLDEQLFALSLAAVERVARDCFIRRCASARITISRSRSDLDICNISSLAMTPPIRKRGHFYLAERGHLHLGLT